MAKIAVIATGGKQYVVKAGETIFIEKIPKEAGEDVSFETLLIADESGSGLEVGTPKLSTSAKAKVLKQLRDKKIEVIKFKAKSRYRRHNGHRQHKTKLEVTSI